MAVQTRVVAIRATPQVGKTTLLYLLGKHILMKEPKLEPIYLNWKNREEREGLPYQQYLEQAKVVWEEKNAKLRSCDPNARRIYLIDEAQDSYEEGEFWTDLVKNHNTRHQDIFVLVCVYGAHGVSHTRDPNIESQALRMHSLHLIELRPSKPGHPCMLFKFEETVVVVDKWAIEHEFQLEDGVHRYLHRATDGHPGMIGMLLNHCEQMFYKLLVQHENNFVDWLVCWGRGIWSPWAEQFVQERLRRSPMYSHLGFRDIQSALRQVALQPYGLTHIREDLDAFAFCHKMGYLHTEQPILGRAGTIFTFASPLHRRVAYRRLFPGREPDAVLKNLSLQQICVNAVARFSPSTLQNRRHLQTNGDWGIPEAAFQDELYCCLNLELHYLPILSEYSHTKAGRIDFYISDRKWGIEVLQCGNKTEIAKHTSRFALGGNYQTWDIMDDYIILNFCSRSALWKSKVEDEKIQSHVFHVVIEPDESVAEVYTYDKQLHKSWSLGEGRQRFNADDFADFIDQSSDADDDCMPLQDEPTQRERAMIGEIEKMKRQRERELKERERERQEREQEMEVLRQAKEEWERAKEGTRPQMVREQNGDEKLQEQDKSRSGGGKKRKR
ncbi:MAG: hypothetical protein Q9157_000998 [Trypethelium eluteriae]